MQTAGMQPGGRRSLNRGADQRTRGPSASLSFSSIRPQRRSDSAQRSSAAGPHPSSSADWPVLQSLLRPDDKQHTRMSGPKVCHGSLHSSFGASVAHPNPAAGGHRRRYAASRGRASSSGSHRRTSTASSRCAATSKLHTVTCWPRRCYSNLVCCTAGSQLTHSLGTCALGRRRQTGMSAPCLIYVLKRVASAARPTPPYACLPASDLQALNRLRPGCSGVATFIWRRSSCYVFLSFR